MVLGFIGMNQDQEYFKPVKILRTWFGVKDNFDLGDGSLVLRFGSYRTNVQNLLRHVSINSLGIDFIILFICAVKFDEYNPCLVADGHNQTVFISTDIEYDSIVSYDAGVGVRLLQVVGR